MKNIIRLLIAIVCIPLFHSCDEDEMDVRQPDAFDVTLKDDAALKLSPSNPETTFIYNVESTGDEYWNLTTLTYDVSLESDNFSMTDISKIDFYLFVEETNGSDYNYLGGKQGKLIKTIQNPTNPLQLSISKEEIEQLYANDFSANHNGGILPDDIFELRWVITGEDGSVYDTRTECVGFDCSYGFGSKVVQVAPPIWAGTFDYEWIALTANAQSYGRVSVGQTGTMTFTLQPGSYTEYDVSHLTADYYYGGPGAISYNYDTGNVEVIDLSGNAQTWDITSVDGPTLTIDFSYRYSVGYDEYGTFTLTRTDGQDWPSNINTD